MSPKRMRIAAALAVTVLGFGLGSAYWFAAHLKKPGYVHRTPQEGLHPRTEPPYTQRHWMGHYGDPLQEFGLAFENVEFPAVDHSTLRGWLVRPAQPSSAAIVTGHGGEGDRRTFLRQLPMLHNAGYAVLLFDFREHGISDGTSRGMAFGWRENYDISSAARFLKEEQGYRKLAAFGTSMGAVSVLLAAARDQSIDAVIAENPFASATDVLSQAPFFNRLPRWYCKLILGFFRLRFGYWSEPDAIDVIQRISPRPLLLMHGTADASVGVWQSERLYEKAGDPKELWILEGAEHTALFNIAPAEYERRIVGFLNKSLGLVTPVGENAR